MKFAKLLRSRTAWARIGTAGLSAGSLVICTVLAGCTPARLAKPSASFSSALAPVVDQSAAAYRDGVALDNLRNDYEAVVAYQKKDASYNPRNVPDLLSEKDIQVRLAVLAALQVYSKSLVEITKSPDSKELDDAAKSVGSNLTSLGNNLAPSIESMNGIAQAAAATTSSSTTTAPPPPLTPELRNGISTAIDALGQFLVNRTVERELPAKIEEMDPHVQALSKALGDDIQALESIEQRDYDRILNLEKQFILDDEKPGSNVDPQQHRAEIMKLPETARQQREADEKLTALHEAIDKLAKVHKALAEEAKKSGSSEPLKDKLNELADTGNSLGKFYSSLPSK